MEQILQSLRSRGYAADGANFPTGRPDRATLALVMRTGEPAAAKVYPSGGGDITYANMQELWRSSFGERRCPPGLPRPIEYLPDIRVLIMERVEGRPLMELDTLDERTVDAATRLVMSLHECDAQPSKRRDSCRIVRSVKRKAECIAEIAPEMSGCCQQVVEALEAAQVNDLELVPCHGDFSPRNVLVGPSRLVLIDWDRLQQADPARDVAHFGVWCWVRALRRRSLPDWSVLDRGVATYNSLHPGALAQARLAFHIAAALIRSAHDLVTMWPADAYLVPQLAAEALRRLR